MENALKFDYKSFGERLKSMLKVDIKRMLKSKVFYILIACAFVIPILITVMMTMMDGSVSVDPQTGAEIVMKGPENTWQAIGALSGVEGETMGGMDVMNMCNINMMFMLVAVFVCLFISEDFKSGYSKNLFTVRAKKGDYVVSKTFVGFVCGALMLIAYFVGAMAGGAIADLSFDIGTLNVGNIMMCMIAKIFLMLVFVSIFVIVSIASKQKTWLAICGSLGAGMLLFMMVPMITPLESTIINVFLCICGGTLFGVGLGFVSNSILKKTSLV